MKHYLMLATLCLGLQALVPFAHAEKATAADAQASVSAVMETGLEVTLLAIGGADKDGKLQWWKPDGTLLEKLPEGFTPPPGISEAPPYAKGQKTFLLLRSSRWTGTTRERGLGLDQWASEGGDFLHTLSQNGQVSEKGSFSSATVLLPGNRDRISLDVIYSAARYEKIAGVMPPMQTRRVQAGNSTRYTGHGGISSEQLDYLITEPAAAGDHSVVASVSNTSIDRLAARLPDGTLHVGERLNMQGDGSGNTMRYLQTWKFPPLETQDVQEFEVQQEVRARLRFHDLSLKPGHRTEPRAGRVEEEVTR